MKTPPRFAIPLCALALAVPSASTQAQQAGETTQAKEAARDQAAEKLVAVISPTEGNITEGIVTFERLDEDKVRVTARVTGLKPNTRHGFHVHKFGDLSAPDGTSAGGHFNPENQPHALPDESGKRHAGDLGNLEADASGVAEKTMTVSNLSLCGEHGILGRAIIVHAQPDTGEQPTGSAGARIGNGVIGYMNRKKQD